MADRIPVAWFDMTNASNEPAVDSLRTRIAAWYLSAVYGLILLDALLTYLIRIRSGLSVPVNVVVVPMLAVFVLGFSFRLKNLSQQKVATSGAIMSVAGLVIGYWLNEQDPMLEGYVSILGCLPVFWVGQILGQYFARETPFVRVSLAAAVLNTVLSCVILLKLAPALFPMKHALWSFQGRLIERPEVFTDQNFTLFYLVPGVLLLAIPKRSLAYYAGLVLTCAAFYILARLQTRSGAVLLGLAAVLASIIPFIQGARGRRKLWLVAIAGAVLIAWASEQIWNVSYELLIRFGDRKTMQGANGRLESLTYLFEVLPDPRFWFAFSSEEFQRRYNMPPHCNPTAFYTEGGLLGFCGWIAAFGLPLARLIKPLIRGQLSAVHSMIVVGGGIVMLMQLSLYVPTFKQPWLWGGLVSGVLANYEMSQRRAASQRYSKNVSLSRDLAPSTAGRKAQPGFGSASL